MFQPSKELAVLKGLLNETPLGSHLTYANIEAKTGIKMNTRGKSILRSAFRSLKIEYACDVGVGVEIESDKNTMVRVTGRMKRVSGSIRRADKTTTRAVERYSEALPKDDRDRLFAVASVFGAMRAMARGLAGIYKTPKLLTVTDGSIPDFRKK